MHMLSKKGLELRKVGYSDEIQTLHNWANFRSRCDTIDDSGGSTQRHDDEDKCAK